MADLIMCHGDGGDDCVHCFRKNARPSRFFQAYFPQVPREGDECIYYWPMTDLERKESEDVG